jgi:hypothetical protein
VPVLQDWASSVAAKRHDLTDCNGAPGRRSHFYRDQTKSTQQSHPRLIAAAQYDDSALAKAGG